MAPHYEEHDPPDADPTELVCEHAAQGALGLRGRGGRPVLGVDTTVVLDGRIYRKPANAAEAEWMLEELSGRTHEVVSGLCLLTPAWEVVEAAATRVTFRALTPRDLAAYVASLEWEGRAGGYAIQGRGAALVERVEGDYLNVVGLPAGLLVRLLARALPRPLRLRLRRATASTRSRRGRDLVAVVGTPRYGLGVTPVPRRRRCGRRRSPSPTPEGRRLTPRRKRAGRLHADGDGVATPAALPDPTAPRQIRGRRLRRRPLCGAQPKNGGAAAARTP